MSESEKFPTEALTSLAFWLERDSCVKDAALIRSALSAHAATERELEEARALARETADNYHRRLLAAESTLAAERAQHEKTKRERDLAVAHDRQPYPTAAAYEAVCAVLAAEREAHEKTEREHAARIEAMECERDESDRRQSDTLELTNELLTAAESTLAVQRARADGLAGVLRRASEIAEASPELNLSNYGHEQACELNDAMIQVTLLLRAALSRPAAEPEVKTDE